jgi:hypothetical protein
MINRGSKFIAMIAALAVLAGGLMMGGQIAFAQDSVDTSITVENTSCVDERPSSISLNTANIALPNFSGSNPSHGFLAGPTVYTTMYVNACLEGGWQLTGALTAFSSGENSFPASHFRIQGDSWYAGNVWYTDGSARVPGTVGLPWGTWRAFSTASGAGQWTIDRPLSTGTAASRGEMLQGLMTSTWQIPTTTPAGTYTATFTLTFGSTGP